MEIGDKVVDATGKEIGKVKFVKMGDPNAATNEGQWGYDEPGFPRVVGRRIRYRPTPEQAQGPTHARRVHPHRRVRGRDKFAGAGMIDRVESNTVYP